MDTDWVTLFPRLEAAAIYGPGKHELVRNFFNHQKRLAPRDQFYIRTDNFGRVWIRAKDIERVCAALGLPTEANDVAPEDV
jgi:hypothetical protein